MAIQLCFIVNTSSFHFVTLVLWIADRNTSVCGRGVWEGGSTAVLCGLYLSFNLDLGAGRVWRQLNKWWRCSYVQHSSGWRGATQPICCSKVMQTTVCFYPLFFIPPKKMIFATETSDPPQGPHPLHRRGPPIVGSFDSQGQTGDKGGRSHGDEREDAILERRVAESQDKKKEIRRGGNGKERKVRGSVKGVKLETGLWERGGKRYAGLTEHRAICISISCSSTKPRRQASFPFSPTFRRSIAFLLLPTRLSPHFCLSLFIVVIHSSSPWKFVWLESARL